jgi:hypothetical protein
MSIEAATQLVIISMLLLYMHGSHIVDDRRHN